MFKVKVEYSMTKFCCLFVDFNHSQHINTVFLFLTEDKYFSVWSKRQVIMFWKHKKWYIFFVINVPSPVSFSDLEFHRTKINYEQMAIPWTYYEHNMYICSSSLSLWIIIRQCGNLHKSAMLKSRDLAEKKNTFDPVCLLYTSFLRISKAKSVRRTLLQTDKFFKSSDKKFTCLMLPQVKILGIYKRQRIK